MKIIIAIASLVQFSDDPSRMSWVTQRSNLVVLRTFSKSAALAGLRVGFGAFPLALIEYMWRAKQPYNVSVAAEVAACAALSNPTYLQVRFSFRRRKGLHAQGHAETTPPETRGLYPLVVWSGLTYLQGQRL
jgi:histidinol-phosphate/aromatic aminotransferase/cobyric acid decarboxylase-like protein